MATRTQSLPQSSALLRDAALVVTASIFVAICAHISIPVPFSPVPFTLSNLAVLLVALMLGPQRGFAALALYLCEGAAGAPVFSPAGPGGVAQLVGPTGGYLIAYPAMAYVAGVLFGRFRGNRFVAALAASTLAEIILFACGISWLTMYTHSLSRATLFGLMPFLILEPMKILIASALGSRSNRPI
jgi:biotin transport system substrate-specific component